MISNTSKVLVAMAAVFAGSSAMASGYGVKLQSGVTAGMANAGSGVSDDALAIYANPAAMIQATSHQVAGHFTGVFGSTRFRGTASAGANAFGGTATSVTGSTRNGSKDVAVPSMGLIANAHDRIKVGVMVHAPFGLKFNYGKNSVTRGHVTRAEMTAINVVPSFAVKIIDALAFGAGMQMQYTKVELDRKVQLSDAGALGSRFITVSGNDWSTGWVAGLYGTVTKAWKIGLSYKSKMMANLDGTGEFVVNGNPILAFKSEAKVRFPHIFTLSTSYDLNNAWTVLADVIYTRWSIVRDISIRNHLPTGESTDITPLNWKNSWFFALGANYKMTDKWSLRAGYAYDMAPSRDAFRVVSIPDSNKHWVALGATYSMGKNLALSLSYGHEFFQKGKIQNVDATNLKGNLTGRVKNSVDLVSVQFNYKF